MKLELIGLAVGLALGFLCPWTVPAGWSLYVAAGLLAALKAERLRLAQAGNVPAYIVFSNAVLEDMAARCPRTMDEFLEVSGVGAVKAQRYGENFLHVIEQYAQDTAEQPGMETS